MAELFWVIRFTVSGVGHVPRKQKELKQESTSSTFSFVAQY